MAVRSEIEYPIYSLLHVYEIEYLTDPLLHRRLLERTIASCAGILALATGILNAVLPD